MRVLVMGGTGFIGRHLVARLVAAGHFVHVPTRHYQNGRDLLVFPTVNLFVADLYNDAVLTRLIGECDAVINLIGVLYSRRGHPYGADFAKVHVELPARVARACRSLGISRLIHVSALGADVNGPSAYSRSKAAGEAAVIDAFSNYSDGTYTIFRPSVVFGPKDHFMNLFASLARWLPVIPMAGARTRLQPIFVGDVATVIANALVNSKTAGQIYPLAGLQAYRLGELVRLASVWSGHPRHVLNLPMALGRLQALFFECLPGQPLISRDNLDSLTVDNVSDDPIAPELGFVPQSLESIAPVYLARD
jgi:uncharacterized protein YbjT (DUF2867 family)